MSRLAPLGLLLAACAATPADPDAGATCAFGDPAVVGFVTVDALTELSGLAPAHRAADVLFGINDSGSAAELFAFSALDGTPAGHWAIDGATNVDWEDLAAAPCTPGGAERCLFVADVGDNGASRESVVVYVVPEPLPGDPGPLTVRARLELTYEDGPRDVEAVVVDPATRDVYFVEKFGAENGDHDVLVLAPGESVARRVATYGTPTGDGAITGAALSASGTRLAIRTYFGMQELRRNEGDPFAAFFASERAELALGAGDGFEFQGEVIAYSADERSLYSSSEGRRPPLNRRRCE